MAAKKPRFNLAVVVLLGAYIIAAFLVLTRPGAALSRDGRTVIRIAHWQIEAGPREALEAMIERYEELNPGVRVEQVAVPGNLYKQWLRTQLIGGAAPDIIEFGSFWGGVDDIPPRFFDPISQYVEDENYYNEGTSLEGVKWRDTFRDGLNTPDAYIENLSNYYAVTLCMTSMRVFYNPSLLQEISGSESFPTTYREMRALGETLRRYNQSHDSKITLYAGSKFTGDDLMLERMSSYGGMGVSFANDRFREQGMTKRDVSLEYLRGRWNFDHPELQASFVLMREMAGHLRPGYQQMERDAAIQEFLRLHSLMIFAGTWDATSLRTLSPFELEVTEFPWPRASDGELTRYYWGPVSEGAGTTNAAFYLNKSGKHKEEALDFMRFMTSLEGNTIFARTSGWLPSVRDVEVPDYAQPYLPHFEGFSVRTSYMRGFGSETRDVWSRHMHHLTSPNGGVEPFLEAFQKEFPTALKRDVEKDLRDVYLSIQRDLPPLAALTVLDRMEGLDPNRQLSRLRRESNQAIMEAKLYEAEFLLRYGPAIDELE